MLIRDRADKQSSRDAQEYNSAFPPVEAQRTLVPMSVDTDMMPGVTNKHTTTSLRHSVVIPAVSGKSKGIRPPKGRSVVINVAVSVLLVVIVLGALIAVVPAANGESAPFSLAHFTSGLAPVQKNEAALIASQAATATAVTQGGYDPGGNMSFAGVEPAPTYTGVPASDVGHLNRFFYGQCTYWANMRYHELTGHWVPWLGNAADWAWNSPGYGWIRSNQPNPNGPSIIVLQAYTQGAGYYGHVAVVERGYASAVNGVPTSNWNWNGGWASHSWVTFYSGPGVHFLWFPGS